MKSEDIELDFDDRVSKPSVQPNKKPNNQQRFYENDEDLNNNKAVMKPQPKTTEKKNSIKNNIRLDNKTKTAIQIIRYDSHHRFEFNDEVEEVISK